MMPYIPKTERKVAARHPVGPGQLNFAISTLLLNYIEFHGLSYARINDVMGALEGAKQEFYRRVAVPYEDLKIEQNGDIGYERIG
jgi:hypothetical protein